MPQEPNLADFESQRLSLFADHGFHGTSLRFADPAGREIYSIEGGHGSLPRVLVHGGLSEASTWAVLAGLLEGRVVVPDRPGYGLTYPIDYRRVDDFMLAASNWLLAVVDGLGEEKVDLVGSSMGGLFSIAFADRHPHRVRRMVFLGAPAGLRHEVPWFLRIWANPILGRLIMRSGLDDPEQMRVRIYPGMVAHPERVPGSQLEVEFAAAQIPGTALTSQTMLNALINFRGMRPEMNVRDRLIASPAPTLMVWGSEDTAFGLPALGEEVSSSMSNAEFHRVEDAGHLVWLDEPELVAGLVNEFLS